LSVSLASSTTALILCSNSHLYLVPATIPLISKDNIFLSFIEKGTSQVDIFLANHSTIAVLPTQGSPNKIGLFLVFLFKTDISLSISSSLHKIFSIFHSLASFVKSVE